MLTPGQTSPPPSSAAVSSRMSRVRTSNTHPELALRSALHARGLRFRVHRPIPGVRSTPDIVFGPARVAVFVQGCFWHGCFKHRPLPMSNTAWWAAKIEATRARDERIDRELQARGWSVVRVWEPEDAAGAAQRVSVLVARRAPG